MQIKVASQRPRSWRAGRAHEVDTRQAVEINGAQTALFSPRTIGKPGYAYTVNPCHNPIPIHAAHIDAVSAAAEIHACVASPGKIFPAVDTPIVPLCARQPGSACRHRVRRVTLNLDSA